MDYKLYAGERFLADIYAVETTAVRVENAGPDYARHKLKIDRCHFHVAGSIMGGAIFTLADYTVGVVANIGKAQSVKLSSAINLIRATKSLVHYVVAQSIKCGISMAY